MTATRPGHEDGAGTWGWGSWDMVAAVEGRYRIRGTWWHNGGMVRHIMGTPWGHVLVPAVSPTRPGYGAQGHGGSSGREIQEQGTWWHHGDTVRTPWGPGWRHRDEIGTWAWGLWGTVASWGCSGDTLGTPRRPGQGQDTGMGLMGHGRSSEETRPGGCAEDMLGTRWGPKDTLGTHWRRAGDPGNVVGRPGDELGHQ